MIDLQAPTTNADEAPQIDIGLSAALAGDGLISPNASAVSDTTSAPVSPPASNEANAIAPSVTLAAAVPTNVKETFKQKLVIDGQLIEENFEEAYHYLLAEIRKIYTSL